MKAIELFLVALLFTITLSCTNNESNNQAKIGYSSEYSDLVHVAFVFPISEKISNDTLFIIVVSDSLIECINKSGDVMHKRSFKDNNYEKAIQ